MIAIEEKPIKKAHLSIIFSNILFYLWVLMFSTSGLEHIFNIVVAVNSTISFYCSEQVQQRNQTNTTVVIEEKLQSRMVELRLCREPSLCTLYHEYLMLEDLLGE